MEHETIMLRKIRQTCKSCRDTMKIKGRSIKYTKGTREGIWGGKKEILGTDSSKFYYHIVCIPKYVSISSIIIYNNNAPKTNMEKNCYVSLKQISKMHLMISVRVNGVILSSKYKKSIISSNPNNMARNTTDQDYYLQHKVWNHTEIYNGISMALFSNLR